MSRAADWGEPPWQVGSAPRVAPPARCDVAVVGGGLAGLASARELALRGCQVALFEAARIGAGSSGRSGGLVLEDTAVGALPGVGGCIAALEQLVADERIECELSLPGCWELAHSDVEPLWRDGEGSLGIAQKVPGGSLDCGRLLDGLARGARHAGATLCERAPVRALGNGRIVLDDGKAVACDHVVLALNAYTPALLAPGAGFAAGLSLALLSEPLEDHAPEALGLGSGTVFYTIDLPYLWGRRLGRSLLVGGGMAFDPDGQLEHIELAAPELAARLDALEARVRGLHDSLAALRFPGRWGGPVAFRAGRLPLLARVGAGRCIVTGAYAGHGVALSLRIGRLIAEAIADGTALPEWGQLEATPSA